MAKITGVRVLRARERLEKIAIALHAQSIYVRGTDRGMGKRITITTENGQRVVISASPGGMDISLLKPLSSKK